MIIKRPATNTDNPSAVAVNHGGNLSRKDIGTRLLGESAVFSDPAPALDSSDTDLGNTRTVPSLPPAMMLAFSDKSATLRLSPARSSPPATVHPRVTRRRLKLAIECAYTTKRPPTMRAKIE